MLSLRHITKTFPGVTALSDVSLDFVAGNVHALCGENGAGKSTLMNIITGNIKLDDGEILWKGSRIDIQDIRHAQSLGINIVYQERSLADALTVAENIFPNRQPVNRLGLISYPELFRQTKRLLDELRLHHISPATMVADLSAAEKQMIEIAKAISLHPSLLILDEPTASLTDNEVKILFGIIRRLKKDGACVIYISHRMEEIREIADDVSILKDGKFQGTVNAATTPVEQMIRMMVGRDLQQMHFHSTVGSGVKLELKRLSGKGFSNISFQIHEGEILGLAGLMGSGRTALARAIFGDSPPVSGTILKDGKEYSGAHPHGAIKRGIAYIPEERKSLGLFLEKTLTENIGVVHLNKVWYKKKAMNHMAEKVKTEFDIRTPSIHQFAKNLSGGNQQKTVLGKWMSVQPDLLIVNEPTHGVDVGSKASIYQLLKDFAARGNSVLLISSELTELLLLSDRIAVMHQGELVAILPKEQATEESITAFASGLKQLS